MGFQIHYSSYRKYLKIDMELGRDFPSLSDFHDFSQQFISLFFFFLFNVLISEFLLAVVLTKNIIRENVTVC